MNNEAETDSLPAPVIVTSTRLPVHPSHREPGSSNHRGSRRAHRHRGRSSSRRSRSRQRHASRQENRNNCRVYCKNDDRNFAAAACSMIAIVLLATSLEPDWVTLSGGKCHLTYEAPGTLKSLSTTQFFYNGHFYKNYAHTKASDTVYKFGPPASDFMVNCVTYPAVLLFKSCIAFTFIAIITSFVAFLMDLIAPKYNILSVLRRNAILHIITVLICILIILFTYWITVAVNKLQLQHLLHEGSRVVVTFGVGFYLVTGAGVMAIMAAACTCLQRQQHPHHHHHHCESSFSGCHHDPYDSHHQLYFDDTEVLLPPTSSPSPPPESEQNSGASDLPPPPAYAP